MWFIPTLDWQRNYKKDKKGLYGSILSLPEQIEATWEELTSLKLPESYKKVDEILLVGMGGSALGARVAVDLLERDLKVPFLIQNDYHLPAFVDSNTLVILASYSGNTEEILSAASEVEKRKAKVVVMATGGKLMEWAKKKKIPCYQMEKLINPGNQPRMATGHSVVGVLGILNNLGLIKLSKKDVELATNQLRSLSEKWRRQVQTIQNPAKKMAMQMKGKGVVFIGARHLKGAGHVFKNQVNENAKTFAVRFDIPELDHHLTEGLGFPDELNGKLLFLFLDSKLYEEQIRKRLLITEDIVMQQGHEVIRLLAESENEFVQVWEVILFGEFVSYYLAILNDLDPSPIPWVDYLKKRLE